jgi:taurine dioxygenase
VKYALEKGEPMFLESSAIDVRKAAGSIGAEITGVRVGPGLPDEVVKTIREALLEHKVLFFRGQHHLDDEEQAGFAGLFGQLTKGHATKPGVRPEDRILEMDSHRGGKAPAWHTDATYTDRPPAITVLRTVLLPPYGGDTAWANTAAAYAGLEPETRELADSLRVLHSNSHSAVDKRAGTVIRPEEAARPRQREFFETEHPVVRVHPESGERAFLLGQFAKTIVDRDDSADLIDRFQHAITRLENTVRWRWRLGDVAMWDNRASQHYAIYDYGDHQRKIRRCMIAGDIPVGVDGRHSVAVEGDASGFAVAV